MVLGLVMCVISISFVIFELRKFVQTFIEKRKIAIKDKRLSEVVLARPLKLLCIMSQCAETTLATIVIKDMIVGTFLEGNIFVVTLPSVVSTFGCVVMALCYSPLVSRFGVRNLSIFSCISTFVSYVLCVQAVLQGNIILLTIGIFSANSFREVLYLYTSALPMCYKDEKMRSNLNAQLSTCSISSSVIMGVFVGWTVDFIGDFTVYIVAAIPIIIEFFIAMIYIPIHSITEASQENHKRQSGLFKDAITLFTNLRIVVYILGPSLVVILCSCYRNLIFPYIADDLGLSSSVISNILVLSNAIIYYLTMNSKKVIGLFSSFKLLVICQIIMGVLLIMFLFNDSILWIIIILMMSQYFQKLISSTGSTYYQGIAMELNLNANNIAAIMSQIPSICNLIVNGILGCAITVFGLIGACVASGIYALTSGGVIALSENI